MSNARNLSNLLGTGTTVPRTKMPDGGVLQLVSAQSDANITTSNTSATAVSALTQIDGLRFILDSTFGHSNSMRFVYTTTGTDALEFTPYFASSNGSLTTGINYNPGVVTCSAMEVKA
jgi:hypothetical protein